MEDFVDLLIQEKGLDNLDDEIVAQLKRDLLVRAENRVNATLIAALPLEKLVEAQGIVEAGNEAQIQEFFAKHVPNLNEVIAAELVSFRQTYLA